RPLRAVPAGTVLLPPPGDARSPVPGRPRLPARYVRPRVRTGGQPVVGPRPPGLPLQGRLRGRQARAGGALEGRGARGRPPGRHVELHLPRLRPDPPRRGPDRRPGEDPRDLGGGGGGTHHADGAGDQAARRARGGGRAGHLPLLGRGILHQRRLADNGRWLERPLTAVPANNLRPGSPHGLPWIPRISLRTSSRPWWRPRRTRKSGEAPGPPGGVTGARQELWGC